MITPRTAELLSYLQGLAPVGQWVSPKPEWLRTDLGINNRVWLFRMIDELRSRGIIDTRRPHGGKHRMEYRVLRRLESGIKIGCKPVGRPKGVMNGWGKFSTARVAYCGSERSFA